MTKFIRSVKVVTLFGLFQLFALLIRYLIFPFQKSSSSNLKTLCKSWQFFLWLLKKTEVITLKIQDIEKIKNIKNSIIVSTHPSILDIVILMSIIPNSTCFVAKKLTKNPFFKGMVELLFVVETDSINEWLDNSLKHLNNGMNLIIFPMGTRHAPNEELKIKRGAALIAQKSGVDIVALDIQTDVKFLCAHQPIYDAGTKPVEFNVNYLEKINTKEYLEKYKDEVTFKKELTNKIKETIYKHKN